MQTTTNKCEQHTLTFIIYTNQGVSWKCCSPNVSFWTWAAAVPAWFLESTLALMKVCRNAAQSCPLNMSWHLKMFFFFLIVHILEPLVLSFNWNIVCICSPQICWKTMPHKAKHLPLHVLSSLISLIKSELKTAFKNSTGPISPKNKLIIILPVSLFKEQWIWAIWKRMEIEKNLKCKRGHCDFLFGQAS